MQRRTFLKTVGGLVVLSAFSAAGGLSLTGCNSAKDLLFTTAETVLTGSEVGPVMQGGIELVYDASLIEAQSDGTSLFVVDELGAELVRLADGTQSIDEITLAAAENVGASLKPADVAQFFVTLGQSGYLANRVEVDMYEVEI